MLAMFCDYCRRLFEFRQKVERYNPPQKDLAGISATSSASWLQPTRRIEQEEIEWREETEEERGKQSKLEARPKLEIYEDAEDLFTPRLLWWKVPIGKEGCEWKDSHVLNTECQTCKMIFRNISASLIEVLLKRTNQENNSIALVYQLKSITNSGRKMPGIASNEVILSVWLEVGQDLLPMGKLQVKELGKCIHQHFTSRVQKLNKHM
jgi:hypothetical protein